jgi:epoxyqueuosine reductase
MIKEMGAVYGWISQSNKNTSLDLIFPHMIITKNQIEIIKAEATTLGFSLLGIAHINSNIQVERFLNWLDLTNAVDLDYLRRDETVQKRKNPDILVPGSRSVLILGYPYPKVSHEKLSNSRSQGWISAYGLQADYHILFRDLGKKFLQKLSKIFPTAHFSRLFSDSAPILERGFAMATGSGWIGKNSNYLSQDYGSFFLLSEVFTDLECDTTSQPMVDRCGNCHKCIDLCPTKCILSNRTIDASRCIAYLTIENKKEIPRDLRSKIGQWVFGCDACQIVCPWNQKNLVEQTIHKKIVEPLVELSSQLSFSTNEFEIFYDHTPVLRAKWSGFLRNLIVAAGNSKNPDLEPIISYHLQENPISMIRSHAAWSLGNLKSSAARNSLFVQKKRETNSEVIAEIEMSLE